MASATEEVLRQLERDAQFTSEAVHQFQFGDMAILRLVTRASRHWKRYEKGNLQYQFTPTGCPTSLVDRDTALRILGSEIK